MTDRLRLEGVMAKGYGNIPKLVMQDTDLSIEAKAIYAYLASYAGGGETAFPSVSITIHHLGISENRYYRHRRQLIDKGYMSIKRERVDNGFSKNIYTLHSFVHLQNEGIQNEGIQNEGIQNEGIQNEGTNKNSLNNNSLNNNNTGSSSTETTIRELSQFYQQNFGVLNPYTLQNMNQWAEDIGGDLVLEALKRALKRGKRYSYAEGIMKNWVNNNINTLEDVEAQEVAYKNERKSNNSKGSSSWEELFDEVNDKEEVSNE